MADERCAPPPDEPDEATLRELAARHYSAEMHSSLDHARSVVATWHPDSLEPARVDWRFCEARMRATASGITADLIARPGAIAEEWDGGDIDFKVKGKMIDLVRALAALELKVAPSGWRTIRTDRVAKWQDAQIEAGAIAERLPENEEMQKHADLTTSLLNHEARIALAAAAALVRRLAALSPQENAEVAALRAEREDMTAAASALSGDITAFASALRTHTPYGDMCRDPLACHARSRCPRDPVCGE